MNDDGSKWREKMTDQIRFCIENYEGPELINFILALMETEKFRGWGNGLLNKDINT